MCTEWCAGIVEQEPLLEPEPKKLYCDQLQFVSCVSCRLLAMAERIGIFSLKLASNICNAEFWSLGYRASEINCTNDGQHKEELTESIQPNQHLQ